ncbi:MAG: cyclic nucleotide-binding domain-containing protein [Emcibacteraceae bacterium]|nr:cyclic nucleotide-binding domain-containing protein [Emcibacteraceae bacterium]
MTSMNERHFTPNCVGDGYSSVSNAGSCEQCVARHISMCSVLNENEIGIISSISKNITKQTKQIICTEGDTAKYLYNIKKGCVRISKMLVDGRRQIIGFLFPGEFFGLACTNGYSYSAETITETDLCQMPRTQLFQKFSELPSLGQKVLEITRTELQFTHDQMLLLGRKRAKEKLCSFLLTMQNKSSLVKNIEKNQLFLPMSRSDIADYLGLTIETVSRQFTILTKEKIISLEGNPLINILDLGRMEIIASGE